MTHTTVDTNEYDKKTKYLNCGIYQQIINHSYPQGLTTCLDWNWNIIAVELFMENIKEKKQKSVKVFLEMLADLNTWGKHFGSPLA